MRIVVTGGTGKAGRWVVKELRERGHDVQNVDLVRERMWDGTVLADLTDLGQAHDVLSGADAVVHLAAIPAPGLRTEGETFRINTLSTYNVFSAAVVHKLHRVVWASSETVLGLPFDWPPDFAPIDETISPRPESSYALSKLVSEEMARQFARRFDTPFVGLRFSNIMEPDDYQEFPEYWKDPQIRRWNLWGYIDARDVATSVAAALEVDVPGADVAIIAAADTCMTTPSMELMHRVYPNVSMRRPVEGFGTLLAIDHAKASLGWQPAHSWREHVSER